MHVRLLSSARPVLRPVFAAAALVGAAVGGAGLTGCDTGPRPAAGIGQDQAPYPNVTVDPELQKFLKVDYSLINTRGPAPDMPLSVQVPVRNQADNQVALQYNFMFFAADGRQLSETGYRLMVLDSRRQGFAAGNAISRDAVAWRLDVRLAR